jgi:hypothetical protein
MAGIKIQNKFQTDKKHEVYINKIKTPSRHTAAQSHHNQHDSNQQFCTVPVMTRGIVVGREAHLPATSPHPDS